MEILKINSRGTLVEYIQSLLKTLGYYFGNIDGIFGNQTKSAVINFQKDFGLVADGIIGQRTWEKLLTFSYIVPTDVSYGYNILNININGLKNKYPFLEIGNIGYSSLGRQIPYIKFGRGRNQVFYSAAIHANEWITCPLLMKFLENLSESYRTNSTIYGYSATYLFNNVSLYIVPMANPDGVDLVVGNIQKYYSDIYEYTQFLSQNYPNIPFPSGWKANINGVDLNLQFPAGWENAREIKFSQGFTLPGPRDFVGEGPLVAPESLALYNFTLSKNFRLIIAYHTQGEVIYWRFLDYLPPGSMFIGEQFARVSGYSLETTPSESGYAGYKDWFIQDYNRPGYTIEVGLGNNPLPISQFTKIYNDNLEILVLGMVL